MLRCSQELPISELPGVGWATEGKLAELGIATVADLQAQTRDWAQRALGGKAGGTLWDYAQGRDARRVEPPRPRRSVGAEVNWGVR